MTINMEVKKLYLEIIDYRGKKYEDHKKFIY